MMDIGGCLNCLGAVEGDGAVCEACREAAAKQALAAALRLNNLFIWPWPVGQFCDEREVMAMTKALTVRQLEGLAVLQDRHRVAVVEFGRLYWSGWVGAEGQLEIMASRFLGDMYRRGFVLQGFLGGLRVYDLSAAGAALLRRADAA